MSDYVTHKVVTTILLKRSICKQKHLNLSAFQCVKYYLLVIKKKKKVTLSSDLLKA